MTGLVDKCQSWQGDTKNVFEVSYGLEIGIVEGTSFIDGHFLNTACEDKGRRASTSVEFKVLFA